MRRTSIFSSAYEKKRRKKKRRITIAVILVLLIASGGALYGSGKLSSVSLKNIAVSVFKKDSSADKTAEAKNEEAKKQEEAAKKKTEESEKNKESETKYFDISLSSGAKAKAGYTEENGTKKFTLVEGLSDGSTFDINKSGSQIVINDASSQEIKTYNLNGEEKNITKTNYVTKSGQSFSKDSIMKKYPGYIWSLNAKFIDDTHVVYISQLPWFRKGDLDTYVWITDLSTGAYQTVWAAKGKTVKIETLNDKGIAVDIDGAKKTITANGNVF